MQNIQKSKHEAIFNQLTQKVETIERQVGIIKSMKKPKKDVHKINKIKKTH